MPGLLRNPDFAKLWAGESISLFGSHVTELALPLTAVLTLDATPGQLGFLGAARFAPFLVVTLLAGVWADRSRRRPILIGANIGRAAALALIPLLAATDQLRIEHLYSIGFMVGALTVLFDVSYVTVVPSLVRRDELVEANSVMQASASVAEVGGPGLGGMLVSAFSAPVAIALDAASYVVSTLTLVGIRKPEPLPQRGSEPAKVSSQIREGLSVTFGDPLLRAMAISAGLYNLFEQSIFVLLALYVTRDLNLSPATLGLVMSLGAAGALLGSVLANRIGRRMGIGRAYVWAHALDLALLLLPLASELSYPAVLLAAAFIINGVALGLTNVYSVTLRQTLTPGRLLGRMNASYRFLTYGAIPIGALIGGTVAEAIGVRNAIALGAAGFLIALVVLLMSPMRNLVTLPDALDDPPTEDAGSG
jgi:predicted MFS family arabinose efflux permease